jgi:hypothetical protein
MNLFHLFSVALLALNFSGSPARLASGNLPEEKPAITTIIKTESAEYIPWVEDKRLAWEDFLCEPKKGTDAVASTSTSLGISYQVVDSKLTYHISCNFSKTKSWGLMKTDYILAHEQGHFDITEIYARKLYEALQNYEYNRRTFKSDINNIYQEIVSQKEALQHRYDGETDHSRNRKQQYDWLETIQNLLTETVDYSTYP